jgi:hypothetical protein
MKWRILQWDVAVVIPKNTGRFQPTEPQKYLEESFAKKEGTSMTASMAAAFCGSKLPHLP